MQALSRGYKLSRESLAREASLLTSAPALKPPCKQAID